MLFGTLPEAAGNAELAGRAIDAVAVVGADAAPFRLCSWLEIGESLSAGSGVVRCRVVVSRLARLSRFI